MENVIKPEARHLLDEEVVGHRRENWDRQRLLERPEQHSVNPAGRPHQPTVADGEAWQQDELGGRARLGQQQRQGDMQYLPVWRG